MAISDYYTETITGVTRTYSTDQFAGTRYTESCSTFAGAINPRSGSEYFAGGRNFPDADYKLFCGDTNSIGTGDLIRWGGSTFNVIFVKDTFNKAHHKLVYLKENV